MSKVGGSAAGNDDDSNCDTLLATIGILRSFLGDFGAVYGPQKIFVWQNGPQHNFYCLKLLYWTTEAHSEYLGTSSFRFGLKIAILGGFMGIFGSFWRPVQPYQNICSPKWTPPSFLALKTTILSLSSTLWGFGNIIFRLVLKIAILGGFRGTFWGRTYPKIQ